MATKKPATKKPAAKAASTKTKPRSKVQSKATASVRKTTASVRKTKSTTNKKTSAKPKGSAASSRSKTLIRPSIRRPDVNLPPDANTINGITDEILKLISDLENYAANLRALDRQRHNGVGLRRLGFIEAALRLSTMFPQYFPHWLNTEKFQRDLDLFNAIRSLIEACRSLEEKAWNINVEAADMIYTDALEYYSQVKDAARRRIDSAESIYNELYEFFRNMRPRDNELGEAEPTEKKIKRDVNALLHGRKDGEVIIKNIKPKIAGGKHEVLDETFKDTAQYKETAEGSIEE